MTGNKKSIFALLKSRESHLAIGNIDPARLIKAAMLGLRDNPDIGKCTPESIFAAVLDSARLGLDPSGLNNSAHLVPFKNNGVYECTLIPGYKGLEDIAVRSGVIILCRAGKIPQGSMIRYVRGLHPDLAIYDTEVVAAPVDATLQAAKVDCYYAVAELPNGNKEFELMTKAQIDSVRKGSRSSAWRDHFDAMAKKTVIKRLMKQLPQSTDMAIALDMEDAAETGRQSRTDILDPDATGVSDAVPAIEASDYVDVPAAPQAAQLWTEPDLLKEKRRKKAPAKVAKKKKGAAPQTAIEEFREKFNEPQDDGHFGPLAEEVSK